MDILMEFWSDISTQLYITFIEDKRYELFLEGLFYTVLISVLSTIVGLILGVVIALIRVERTQTGKFKIIDKILGAYVAVIRGTPIVLQLLIMYGIILVGVDTDFAWFVAVAAFGLNSAAYVSEIIRAGIIAVDIGQMEAGRTLGFSRFKTMLFIVFPQAIKNILPALGNEFITILKETSIAGYIPVTDLTKASNIVQSRTYEPFFPLIAAATFYFILVVIISHFFKKMERRFAKSDRG